MIFDCLLPLIGFCQNNQCLGQAPSDMNFTPLTGVYLDKHPTFKAAIITENAAFWNAGNWTLIKDAGYEVRRQLAQDLVKVMRTKIEPTVTTLRVEIGEDRAGGYHGTPSIPIVCTLPTKRVIDASFRLTHIGIRANLIIGPTTVTVQLKKNGTLIDAWDVDVTDMSATRMPLPTSRTIELDGSVYTFSYSYPAGFFPTKNPMDCACPMTLAQIGCFFQPFSGDAGGLRLLGEIVCNELAYPCSIATADTYQLNPLAVESAASAYRSYLLAYLLQQLITGRQGSPNAFTLLKAEDLTPVVTSLQTEYQSYLVEFGDNWNPVGGCCYEPKTKTFVVSQL